MKTIANASEKKKKKKSFLINPQKPKTLIECYKITSTKIAIPTAGFALCDRPRALRLTPPPLQRMQRNSMVAVNFAKNCNNYREKLQIVDTEILEKSDS